MSVKFLQLYSLGRHNITLTSDINFKFGVPQTTLRFDLSLAGLTELTESCYSKSGQGKKGKRQSLGEVLNMELLLSVFIKSWTAALSEHQYVTTCWSLDNQGSPLECWHPDS